MPDRVIIPFELKHLYEIDLIDSQESQLLEAQEFKDLLINNNLIGCTVKSEGKIVGCFGITNEYYAWSLMGKGVENHIKWLVKKCNIVFKSVPWCFTLNRPDDTKANKWVEMLGFENQGLVENPENGFNYINYLKVNY